MKRWLGILASSLVILGAVGMSSPAAAGPSIRVTQRVTVDQCTVTVHASWGGVWYAEPDRGYQVHITIQSLKGGIGTTNSADAYFPLTKKSGKATATFIGVPRTEDDSNETYVQTSISGDPTSASLTLLDLCNGWTLQQP